MHKLKAGCVDSVISRDEDDPSEEDTWKHSSWQL